MVDLPLNMQDSFPYRHRFISPEDVKKLLPIIANHEPTFIHQTYTIKNMKKTMDGKILLVDAYSLEDILSGAFTDTVRVKCKRKDELLSPFDYWEKHQSEPEFEGDVEKQNDLLFEKCCGCGVFRPKIMVDMVKYLKSTSVLDFSAGWGDRLIAAVALEIPYVGVDPNQDLTEGYHNIIQLANNPEEYVMVCSPFQTAVIPTRNYDLVFTSPPYFDLEEYSNYEGDSLQHKPSLDAWKTSFLYPSLDKAWDALCVGGHMVVVVNDTPTAKYTEDMLQYCKTLPGVGELEVISYAHQNLKGHLSSPQPMWMWKKGPQPKHRFTLNPPVVVEHFGDLGVNVIRDDYLIGGTKQRCLDVYLNSFSQKEIVYVGPATGYAQIALAYVCSLIKKTAVLFLQHHNQHLPPLTQRTKAYNPVIYVHQDKLSNIKKKAQAYIQGKDAVLLPFGLGSPEYQHLLSCALKEALKGCNVPLKVYLPLGSGTLTRALGTIWDSTELHVVRVGMQVYSEDYEKGVKDRMVVHDATIKYKFNQATTILPPYPSLKSYDAKVWEFVQGEGCVWNVGCD